MLQFNISLTQLNVNCSEEMHQINILCWFICSSVKFWIKIDYISLGAPSMQTLWTLCAGKARLRSAESDVLKFDRTQLTRSGQDKVEGLSLVSLSKNNSLCIVPAIIDQQSRKKFYTINVFFVFPRLRSSNVCSTHLIWEHSICCR